MQYIIDFFNMLQSFFSILFSFIGTFFTYIWQSLEVFKAFFSSMSGTLIFISVIGLGILVISIIYKVISLGSSGD